MSRSKTKKSTKKLSGNQSRNQSRNQRQSVVNVYEKSVLDPWFSLISMEAKVAEGRPNKGFFKNLKKNDIVIWFNEETGKKRTCKTKIVDVVHYKTFRDMLQNEGMSKVLPAVGAGIKTIDDGVKVYRQWYNKEIERKFGIVAIKVKVVN